MSDTGKCPGCGTTRILPYSDTDWLIFGCESRIRRDDPSRVVITWACLRRQLIAAQALNAELLEALKALLPFADRAGGQGSESADAAWLQGKAIIDKCEAKH